MSALYVGLMSGTSGDGVSLALADFSNGCKVLNYKTYPYPAALQRKITNPRQLTLSEVSALEFELGNIFADAILKFLKSAGVSPNKITAIGSHGQTLFHEPKGKIPNTFQAGESSVIAERTGITTVSDFRPRDIAAGGEGAPLLPYFDQYFFGQNEPCALQNIGGIANVAIVGKSIPNVFAFDTGPGNCLIDWAVQEIKNGKVLFDRDGILAKKGMVWMDCVQKMIAHPYFKAAPPKSTGRELFNEKFLPAKILKGLKSEPFNVLATLTYFTAFTIAESYKKFVAPKYKVAEMIVSGGGLYNKTLMWHLQSVIFPVKISSIERYGIASQAKEPAAFAFFAHRAVRGEINHAPSGTGAKRAAILGKITPGRNFHGIR